MRIKLLILSIIVAAGFSVAADAVLFGNMLETDTILTPKGVTNAILTTALTVESDPVAYPLATNALALAEGALQPPATNGLLRVEADTLATVTARGATTTKAVTIGMRGGGDVGVSSFANGANVVASGNYSHAEGIGTTASGYYSHAEGSGTTASGIVSHAEGQGTTASGIASHAEGLGTTASGDVSHSEGMGSIASGSVSHASGYNAVASNITAFAWQGADVGYSESPYGSHGPGTFNINPVGGLSGFWIGETPLSTTLSGYATTGAVADAVAHAESAHGMTDNGGFAGGNSASAQYGGAVGYSAYAEDGGALGYYASAQSGGAVGYSAYAEDGGAVGYYAYAQYGGAVGYYAYAQYGGAVGVSASAQNGGAVGAGAYAEDGGAVGSSAMTSSGFAGGYRAMAALDNTGYGTAIDAIQLGTGWNPDANTLQIYDYKLMNADGSIPAERMASALSGYATTGAVAAVQAGKADAEVVVAGAVGTASAGNRYFWTSATNVVLRVNLASGQVVNLAKLNNTGASSITATGAVGWEWTGGEMTNTIPAGKSMTFGFLVDAATGKTNAYATGVSK